MYTNGEENISEQVCNALTELGNIGAGNATTSLSSMLATKLTMTPPKVGLHDFDYIENVLDGADNTVVGVLSEIEGVVQGMILFVIGIEDAKNLVNCLVASGTDWKDTMGLSAITEIANILIGSYVASLETLCGLKLRYSLPQICIDMAGAVLGIPCTEFGKVSDNAILINSEFEAGEQKINGYIMFMAEAHSFDVMLNKLGIGGTNE